MSSNAARTASSAARTVRSAHGQTTTIAAKAPPPRHPITIEWVGDMALSTEIGLPPGGPEQALEPLKGQLQDANITAGNLEGTLSVGGASKCGGANTSTCFAFQAPPSYAEQYRTLGFDVLNQANNHALDYGASGQVQTEAALTGAGVAYTGLPEQITYLNTRNGRVAFLGFAPYSWASNLTNIPEAEALVRRARAHAGLVVVIIHAGAEGADATHTPDGDESYLGEDRGNARAFAHGVIDAGASLVLGSGPHVIRGVERYHGHMVAYSLGNFIGYGTLGLGGVLSESAILRVTIGDGGEVLAARWIPLQLEGQGVPEDDPDADSVDLVSSLSDEDFPSDHFAIDPDGTFQTSK